MDDLQIIQDKIYEIHGQRVMLDRDLAEMYGVETRRLKERLAYMERRACCGLGLSQVLHG